MRNVSIYRPAILLTSQLDESREAPINHTQYCSQDYPYEGYLEHIEKADHESMQERIGLFVGYDRLGYWKASLLPQKVEAQGQSTLVRSAQHVGDDEKDDCNDGTSRDYLHGHSQEANVPPYRDALVAEQRLDSHIPDKIQVSLWLTCICIDD